VCSGIQTIPTGRQNLAEALIDAIYGLVVSVAGEKWASAFFPIVATIFLFVLVANLMDPLTPILSAITVKGDVRGHEEMIPILRSPSTDLNFTVALALVSVSLTQYFGLRAHGLLGYLGKYINVSGFIKFARLLGRGSIKNALGALFMGIIDFFIGIIEFISEIAKIISFSFRLFGNIFAGEVLLIVVPFLLPFLIPLPFLGLEIFVGFMQAFVFALLTLAFMKMATLSHSEGEH
jgi:F-type H+-transporting ATPase subunit a